MTQFPDVSGSNLERKKFNLPDDFAGQLNLVFIAFRQHHQRDVNTWLPHAQALTADYPDLVYYELPTIRSMNFLARAVIDGGMRAGIPSRTAREATITLYLDKQGFREALSLPDESRIYVLLVAGDGKVIWRTSGSFSEQKGAALREKVDQFLAPVASNQAVG